MILYVKCKMFSSKTKIISYVCMCACVIFFMCKCVRLKYALNALKQNII